MKKLFVCLNLMCILNVINAQNFDKKDVAVYNYSLNINNSLGVIANQQISDSVFQSISTILKDSAGLELKPLDFLKKHIGYFLGMPVGSLKNAIKSNLVVNYAKLLVYIDPVGVYSTNNNSLQIVGLGKDKKKVHAKIKVKLELIIYNQKGEKIIDYESKVASSEKVQLSSESFLFGNFSIINQEKNNENYESLQKILFEATMGIVKQF